MSSSIGVAYVHKTLLGLSRFILLPSRSFRNCVINLDKSAVREARFMRKMMGNNKSGKRPWFKTQDASNVPLTPISNAPRKELNHRRIAVLNKLFMTHITDMMTTGSVASEIVGRGVEISRVKVASDFNIVNVFWLARGKENDAEIDEILKRSAGRIRHELTQLRVIGIVPQIQFNKDKHYAKIAEVDRLLATADFGEDYIAADAGYRLKSEFESDALLPPGMEGQVEISENEDYEPPLPPMRMDVFGLKHFEIMAKVKKSMKKSRALHRQDPSCQVTAVTNEESEQHKDDNEDITFHLKREEFAKFLKKRQLMQKQLLRGKKNYSPEFELYENEYVSNATVESKFEKNDEEDKDIWNDYEYRNVR